MNKTRRLKELEEKFWNRAKKFEPFITFEGARAVLLQRCENPLRMIRSDKIHGKKMTHAAERMKAFSEEYHTLLQEK